MAWQQTGDTYHRLLGDSEYGFFSASTSAAGDMFLHLSFRAPKKLLLPQRVLAAWAVILLRHPLLLSEVCTDSSEPHFRFTPPNDIESALDAARTRLSFRQSSKQGLISEYLNGGRFLTNEVFSHLCISRSAESTDLHPVSHNHTNGVNGINGIVDPEAEYDLLLCSPHFSGDGAALHQCAHDLLVVLGSPKFNLHPLVQAELSQASDTWEYRLPLAMETRLRQPSMLTNKWAIAASQIGFAKGQEREVGGHGLPRKQRFAQNTVLKERTFSREETETVLARCKAEGVTANHTLFALVDVAWAQMLDKGQDLPIMSYTALNLRPYLNPSPFGNDEMSYWFLALTYFNVVLPSFLPSSNLERTFWERSRSAKSQIASVMRSPFLIPRALMMASLRSQRAGRPLGRESLPPPPLDAMSRLDPRPPAPSKALMGISLMGNLDKMYVSSMYPSIKLLDVATASRQRQGGILLLSHTFRGMMSLHLVYDEFGFEEGSIERFWELLQGAAEAYLIGKKVPDCRTMVA